MITLWWSLWRDQQLGAKPTSKEVRATEGATHEMRDKCLTEYGGYIELHYTYATTQTFSFDLCNVIDCKGYIESWRGYDVYLCIFGHGVPGYQKWCPSWSFVWWHSRPGYWREQTKSTEGKMKSKNSFSFVRAQLATGTGLNPLLPNFPGQCHDSKEDSFYLIIGVDQAGADTMGIIKVRLHHALSPNHSMTPRVNNMTVTCSAARPTLFTVPAPLFWEDRPGFDCMLQLHMRERVDHDCAVLSTPFPVAGNYTCLTRINTTPVGAPEDSWCAKIINVTKWENMTLPVNWTGTCGLVTLAQELLIQQTSDLPVSSRRTKRSAYSHDVYIDAIGVPRGIPKELKAQGEISAGFASILPWIQINKNVALINYVYYHQQRHTNLTNTALTALGEQMSATSLMTMQNRMALDMLLAEKGGVCAMFGDVCCSFIPNNTAPNGSFTRAMNKLETLQIELRTNAGHGQWLQDTFGKWKELILAFVTVAAGIILFLMIIACCVMPCIRSMMTRISIIIDTKVDVSPPPFLSLLLFFRMIYEWNPLHQKHLNPVGV
uniref:Envelope polyprotein n=1 Tax=Pundamilia nyererei TaxID=303518 RepID=A0A3B4FG57_9CICH